MKYCKLIFNIALWVRDNDTRNFTQSKSIYLCEANADYILSKIKNDTSLVISIFLVKLNNVKYDLKG